MNQRELLAYIQQRTVTDEAFAPLFAGDWQARAKHLKIAPIDYAAFVYLRFIEVHTEEEGIISKDAYDAFKGIIHHYLLSGTKKVDANTLSELLEKTGSSQTSIKDLLLKDLPYFAQYADECIAMTDKLSDIQAAISNGTPLPDDKKLTPSDYHALSYAMSLNRYYEKIIEINTKYGRKIYTTLLSDNLRKLYNAGELFEEVLELCTKDAQEHYQGIKPDIMFIDWKKERKMYAHADHSHHKKFDLGWQIAKLDMMKAVTRRHHTAALVPKQGAPLGYIVDEIYPVHNQSDLTMHEFLISEPCHLVLSNLMEISPRDALKEKLGSDDKLEKYLRGLFDQLSIQLLDDVHLSGNMLHPTHGQFKRVVKPSVAKLAHRHRSSSPESADAIATSLVSPPESDPKDISNMLCSGYVARRLLTLLHRMNTELQKAYPELGDASMKLPFMKRPLNSIFPDELMSELAALDAVKICTQPPLFSKAVRI